MTYKRADSFLTLINFALGATDYNLRMTVHAVTANGIIDGHFYIHVIRTLNSFLNKLTIVLYNERYVAISAHTPFSVTRDTIIRAALRCLVDLVNITDLNIVGDRNVSLDHDNTNYTNRANSNRYHNNYRDSRTFRGLVRYSPFLSYLGS